MKQFLDVRIEWSDDRVSSDAILDAFHYGLADRMLFPIGSSGYDMATRGPKGHFTNLSDPTSTPQDDYNEL